MRRRVEEALQSKEQRQRRWRGAKDRHEKAVRALEELRRREEVSPEDIKRAEEETNKAWLEAMMAVDPDLSD